MSNQDKRESEGASVDADRATAAEPVVSALRDGIPSVDKTAMSFWLPQIVDAGLPTPETRFVPMVDEVCKHVFASLWGENVNASEWAEFERELTVAAEQIGAPVFLRTDHTSGKHQWSDACFVSDISAIMSHVFSIAEYSEMAGFRGLPYRMWAVREMLPTIPYGVAPNYRDMPLCKEFRFFVDGDNVQGFQPYWPREAIEQGGSDMSEADYVKLCDMGDARDELFALASKAGEAVGGAWSVDLLETERGWFLTDMAEAEKSYLSPDYVDCAAQGIEARSDETLQAAQPEGREPDPEGDAPNPQIETPNETN